MIINSLMQRNLSQLTQVAKRIAPKQSHDLLTDTFLNLINAPHPKTDHEFIKYFSRCMSNNFKNQKSTFNKNFVIKEINCTFEQSIDLNEIDKQEVFNELMVFKKQLPLVELILFELHFELGLSSQKIADRLSEKSGYNVSKSSMKALIKPIKDKLRCKQWTSLNSWAFSQSRGYSLRGQHQRNTSSLF